MTYTFPNGVTYEINDDTLVCTTRFADGSVLHAAPQDNDDYKNRAKELGMTPWMLCQTHDLIHHLISSVMGLPFSPTLYYEARKLDPPPPKFTRHREEVHVLSIQRALAKAIEDLEGLV